MLIFSTRYFKLLDTLRSSVLPASKPVDPFVIMTQHVKFCSEIMDADHHSVKDLYRALKTLCEWKESVCLSFYAHHQGPACFTGLNHDIECLTFNYSECRGNINFLNYATKNCKLFASNAMNLQYDQVEQKLAGSFRFVDVAARCLAIGILSKFLLIKRSPEETKDVQLVLEHQMTLADKYYGRRVGKPAPCSKVKEIYEEILSCVGDTCKVTELFTKRSRPAAKRLVGLMVRAAAPRARCVTHVWCMRACLFIFAVFTVTHLSFLVLAR